MDHTWIIKYKVAWLYLQFIVQLIQLGNLFNLNLRRNKDTGSFKRMLWLFLLFCLLELDAPPSINPYTDQLWYIMT